MANHQHAARWASAGRTPRRPLTLAQFGAGTRLALVALPLVLIWVTIMALLG